MDKNICGKTFCQFITSDSHDAAGVLLVAYIEGWDFEISYPKSLFSKSHKIFVILRRPIEATAYEIYSVLCAGFVAISDYSYDKDYALKRAESYQLVLKNHAYASLAGEGAQRSTLKIIEANMNYYRYLVHALNEKQGKDFILSILRQCTAEIAIKEQHQQEENIKSIPDNYTGEWREYLKGRLFRISHYKNGKRDGVELQYMMPFSDKYYRKGEPDEYTNKVEIVCNYKDGCLDGDWKQFSFNGAVRDIRKYCMNTMVSHVYFSFSNDEFLTGEKS